jgi:hypothetical protein
MQLSPADAAAGRPVRAEVDFRLAMDAEGACGAGGGPGGSNSRTERAEGSETQFRGWWLAGFLAES